MAKKNAKTMPATHNAMINLITEASAAHAILIGIANTEDDISPKNFRNVKEDARERVAGLGDAIAKARRNA